MTRPTPAQFISCRRDPGYATGRNAAMADMQTRQSSAGATFFRFSFDVGHIWLEGWEAIPENPAPFEPLYTFEREAAPCL